MGERVGSRLLPSLLPWLFIESLGHRDKNKEKMASPPFQPHSYPHPEPPPPNKTKRKTSLASHLPQGRADRPGLRLLTARWEQRGPDSGALSGGCVCVSVSVCLGECVSVARAGDRER